jgi:hypothetical protein
MSSSDIPTCSSLSIATSVQVRDFKKLHIIDISAVGMIGAKPHIELYTRTSLKESTVNCVPRLCLNCEHIAISPFDLVQPQQTCAVSEFSHDLVKGWTDVDVLVVRLWLSTTSRDGSKRS